MKKKIGMVILCVAAFLFGFYFIPTQEEEPLKPYRAPKIVITYTPPDVSFAFECKENKEEAKAVLDNLAEIFETVDTVEPETNKLIYVGKFYITMYAATVEQCGNDLGITASGRKVTDDPTCHTVAVDPAVIPLGSYLIIDGYPGIIFRADDTGSAINGYDIDIFTTDEAESKTFNNQSGVKVWIIQN